MIVTREKLTKWISVDVQDQEIERLKKAKSGDVIFTATTTENTDIIDTLIHLSGIQWREGVSGYRVQYYKI